MPSGTEEALRAVIDAIRESTDSLEVFVPNTSDSNCLDCVQLPRGLYAYSSEFSKGTLEYVNPSTLLKALEEKLQHCQNQYY